MSTETDSSWRKASDDKNDALHVVPVADLMDHTLHAECACEPDVDLVERADHSVATIYIHNAKDGRE